MQRASSSEIVRLLPDNLTQILRSVALNARATPVVSMQSLPAALRVHR